MADSENIEIGNKKVGLSTEVTLTVKTIIWIIGILITLLSFLFTWFYFNTQKREEELKKEIHSSIKEMNSDMKMDILSLRNQIFDLAKGQGEIQTGLKTVINKQIGVRERPEQNVSNNSNMAPVGE